MKRDIEYLIKSIIIITVCISTILKIESSQITVFIVFTLVILLNIQLRNFYFKEKIYTLSLLLDFILIYFIFQRFSGLTYLYVFITLIDGLIYAKKYAYAILTISGGLLFFLLKARGLENILLNIFIFLSLIFFIIKTNSMSKKISELEYLYDDIRRYSYDLENAKKQIELYSSKVEQLTQIQERNRISEEIHDSIGHRLTALLFQMEAGIRILDSDRTKGKELLKASADYLREGIDVLRDTVRRIKPKEYKNLIYSIKNMISDFKKNTGANVTFEVIGNAVKIYPGAELTLFKNTQEALTNSVRHGNAKNIQVILTYEHEEVSLQVKDDGDGCDNIKKGMGMTAMEERLSFIGGTLNFSGENGFVIESRIPVSR